MMLPHLRSPLAAGGNSRLPVSPALQRSIASADTGSVSAETPLERPAATMPVALLNDLSERVYEMFKRRLAREKERFGG
jgi:hypothetical protein